MVILHYEIPKLSASVNASFSRPDHCFEILPTSVSPSGVRTLNSTSPPHEKVHQGPSIMRATLPSASVISNLARSSVRRPAMLTTVLLGLHAGPGLLDISDDISGWGADLQLLQTAGETTGVAAERSVEVEDLSLRIVQDDHIEGSCRAADISSAAVSVLLGFEDVLDLRGVSIGHINTRYSRPAPRRFLFCICLMFQTRPPSLRLWLPASLSSV